LPPNEHDRSKQIFAAARDAVGRGTDRRGRAATWSSLENYMSRLKQPILPPPVTPSDEEPIAAGVRHFFQGRSQNAECKIVCSVLRVGPFPSAFSILH
jgi:hypothetical protein